MGMVAKAVELAETHGWFLTRQFENEANADMHSRTTAREILDDFAGERARLLGHRLRHRRHAQGRRARARQGAARDEDRRLRAGRRAAPRQRRSRSSATPTAPPSTATRRSSRTRCRAGRPTSSRSSPRDAVDMKRHRSHPAGPNADAMRCSRRAGPAGRDLRRHHGGRDARRRAARLRGRARRARPSCACCPTPASAT